MSLEAPDNIKAEAAGLYRAQPGIGMSLQHAAVQECHRAGTSAEDASLGATTEQTSINGPGLQTAERLQNHLGSKWTAP